METYIFDRLDHYFHTLSVTGYYNDKDVEKLLFLIHVHKITRNDFQGLLSPEDYKHIERALYCLFGDCLLPFPKLYDKRISNEPPTSWDYKRAVPPHKPFREDRGTPPPSSSTPNGRFDRHGRHGQFGEHEHFGEYGEQWRYHHRHGEPIHWPDKFGHDSCGGHRSHRCRHHQLGLWHHLSVEARKEINEIIDEELERIRANHIEKHWWDRDA